MKNAVNNLKFVMTDLGYLIKTKYKSGNLGTRSRFERFLIRPVHD